MKKDFEAIYLHDIKNSCISAITDLLNLASETENWANKDTYMEIIEELVNIYLKASNVEWRLKHFVVEEK